MADSDLTLEGLPVEMVEDVVKWIGFDDLCNFRLASRLLCAKASQGCFRKNLNLASKNVYLTTSSLEGLVHMTRQERAGCHLKYLTLSGIVSENDKPRGCRSGLRSQDPIEIHPRLLGDAFHQLKQNTKQGQLESITLALTGPGREGYRGVGGLQKLIRFEHVSRKASNAFHTVLAALSISALPVQNLIVFTSHMGCSLSYTDFAHALDVTDPSLSLKHTKRLALRLSCGYEKPTRSKVTLVTKEVYIESLGQLLRMMPQLEDVELRWSQLRFRGTWERQIFDSVAHAAGAMTSLRKCKLVGFCTSEASLVDFVKGTLLQSLELDNVHLTSGSFGPVFDHMTRKDSPADYLRFAYLYNTKGYPIGYENIKSVPAGAHEYPWIITRKGIEAKEQIVHSLGPEENISPSGGAEVCWVQLMLFLKSFGGGPSYDPHSSHHPHRRPSSP